ncbi:hypothetical protein L6164_018656 [Bauhinia variegata]|uniref:Uncharacterized protein n=1 Tax=Bauhinia variegata TaxID=167791 RepID=A0ACB9NCZ1_BAUVA|nr:hypothetical protein L6164_018656 [Bauhinia variegata]
MAKNNKFTSINFNHIYEKNITADSNTNPAKNPAPSPSYSAASYSAVSSNKGHGRMLVLTRPPPKPVTPPPPASVQPQPQRQHQQQPPKQTQQLPDQPQTQPGSDAISLRPLGRTGTGSSLPSPVLNLEKDKELPPPLISPKPDKFVPPHLRPGFVRREERSGPEAVRSSDAAHRQQGYGGTPGRYREDARPKSGGYERMMMGGGSDMGMSRPGSSGSRPNSSGWAISCVLFPGNQDNVNNLNVYETEFFPEDEDETHFATQMGSLWQADLQYPLELIPFFTHGVSFQSGGDGTYLRRSRPSHHPSRPNLLRKRI